MMNFTNIKLTQNQQLVANACGSMIGSALVASAQATYQYLTQHGTVNLIQVLTFFIGTLWVLLSAAFVAYVPAHIQQELQAAKDTASQASQELATLKQKSVVPASPLVVIHTQAAAATPVQTVPSSVAYQLAAATQSYQTPPVAGTAHVSLTNNASGSTVVQSTPGDVLADLPATAATLPDKITGVIPVYGASAT